MALCEHTPEWKIKSQLLATCQAVWPRSHPRRWDCKPTRICWLRGVELGQQLHVGKILEKIRMLNDQNIPNKGVKNEHLPTRQRAMFRQKACLISMKKRDNIETHRTRRKELSGWGGGVRVYVCIRTCVCACVFVYVCACVPECVYARVHLKLLQLNFSS